jgi:putative ABC transport system permease protein
VAHGGEMVEVDAPSVTPGYFEALRLRVLDGRTFSREDRAADVVVINEAAARRLFPGERAVGHSLTFPTPKTVIGVVSNIRQSGPRIDVTETIYSWLTPDPAMPPTVVIRASAAGPSADALRQVALTVGPRALVERILPGSSLLSNTVARPRHRTLLLGLLGGLGLLLTLIGTGGVSAYAVSRRTQEIAVRLALGADGRSVVWTMMRDAVWPVGAGLLLGLGASSYASRLVASFLFETTPTDPMTFAAAAILLAASAMCAAWLPARKAARVDPVQALRME